MDVGQIIQRAMQITWRYRALWLFGFLLALFGGGSGFGGGGGNNGTRIRGGGAPTLPGNLPFDPDQIGRQFQQIPTATWLTIGLMVALFVLVMIVLSVVVSNVAKTALIGMVQQIETSGTTSIADGFRVGWSHYAFRNFLMEFLVGVAAFVVALVVAGVFVALGIGTGIGFSNSNQAGGAFVGLLCLTLLIFVPLALVASIVVNAVTSFASRYIVLREAGVTESLAAGWRLFRANVGNVVIMIVLLFALTLVWGMITAILGVVTGGLLGVAVGFAVYALTQSAWGFLAALPGVLVTLVLLSILGGIFATFRETVWTLMFRSLADRPPQTAPSLAPTPAK